MLIRTTAAKAGPLATRELLRLAGDASTFAVFSAGKHGDRPKTDMDRVRMSDADRHSEMLRELRARGYAEAQVHSVRGKWWDAFGVERPERAILVEDMTFADARRLADAWEQDAFIFKDPSGVIGMYNLGQKVGAGDGQWDPTKTSVRVPSQEGRLQLGPEAVRTRPQRAKPGGFRFRPERPETGGQPTKERGLPGAGPESDLVSRSRGLTWQFSYDFDDKAADLQWDGETPYDARRAEEAYRVRTGPQQVPPGRPDVAVGPRGLPGGDGRPDERVRAEASGAPRAAARSRQACNASGTRGVPEPEHTCLYLQQPAAGRRRLPLERPPQRISGLRVGAVPRSVDRLFDLRADRMAPVSVERNNAPRLDARVARVARVALTTQRQADSPIFVHPTDLAVQDRPPRRPRPEPPTLSPADPHFDAPGRDGIGWAGQEPETSGVGVRTTATAAPIDDDAANGAGAGADDGPQRFEVVSAPDIRLKSGEVVEATARAATVLVVAGGARFRVPRTSWDRWITRGRMRPLQQRTARRLPLTPAGQGVWEGTDGKSTARVSKTDNGYAVVLDGIAIGTRRTLQDVRTLLDERLGVSIPTKPKTPPEGEEDKDPEATHLLDVGSENARKEWRKELGDAPFRGLPGLRVQLEDAYARGLTERVRPETPYKPTRAVPPPSRVKLLELELAKNGGVDNILKVLHAARPDEIEYWKSWYIYAGDDAQALASKYNVPKAIVAGIIAALSPNVPWEDNILAAEQVLRGQGQRVLDYRRQTDPAAADNFLRKLFPIAYGDPVTLGTFSYTRNIEKAQRILDSYRERGVEDLQIPERDGTATVYWSAARAPKDADVVGLDRARSIFQDAKHKGWGVRYFTGQKASALNPLGEMTEFDPEAGRMLLVSPVTGLKVAAFYRSILEGPTSEEIVLDGHAQNLWRGRPAPLDESSSATPGPERQRMEDDYRKAAAKFRYKGTDGRYYRLTPQQVQAVTWTVWRNAVTTKRRRTGARVVAVAA